VPVTVGTFESTLSLLQLISDPFFTRFLPVSAPFARSIRRGAKPAYTGRAALRMVRLQAERYSYALAWSPARDRQLPAAAAFSRTTVHLQP
jgi:hypothetical protein